MRHGPVLTLSWSLRPPGWIQVVALALGLLALFVVVCAVIFPVAYVFRDSPSTLNGMMRLASPIGIVLGIAVAPVAIAAARRSLMGRHVVPVRFGEDRFIVGAEEVLHSSLTRIDYGHEVTAVVITGGRGVKSAFVGLRAGERAWDVVAIDGTADDLEAVIEGIGTRHPSIELVPLAQGIPGL